MERAIAVLLILVFQFAAGQKDQERAIRDEINHLNTQEVEALHAQGSENS